MGKPHPTPVTNTGLSPFEIETIESRTSHVLYLVSLFFRNSTEPCVSDVCTKLKGYIQTVPNIR